MDIKSTIGVDFVTIEVVMVFESKVENINISIWDTAGQEKYQPITASYARDSHIFLLACDLTRTETVVAIPKWAEMAYTNNQRSYRVKSIEQKCLFHIIGNKSDERSKTQVASDKLALEELCKNLSSTYKKEVRYSICSAKTDPPDRIRAIIKGLAFEYFMNNPGDLNIYHAKQKQIILNNTTNNLVVRKTGCCN